jgi:hypothetical protein
MTMTNHMAAVMRTAVTGMGRLRIRRAALASLAPSIFAAGLARLPMCVNIG